MGLEQMFHSVESQLFNLGRRLWRDPLAEVREEAEQINASLQRKHNRLRRCQEELIELRAQVKSSEAQAALLASRVESFVYVYDGRSAWQHALELDGVRRQLAQHRQRLREVLQVERECLDGIHELEKRLDDLDRNLSHLQASPLGRWQ
jgi:chromosome segregation ATPase